MEKAITEIKILGLNSQRLGIIEKDCLELRKVLNSTPISTKNQEEEEEEEGFTCSSCSVTKPIGQRRENENRNQVYVNSVLILGFRNAESSLEIMEHLDMNVFVEVHFKDGC